jgi:hypothetical protein
MQYSSTVCLDLSSERITITIEGLHLDHSRSGIEVTVRNAHPNLSPVSYSLPHTSNHSPRDMRHIRPSTPPPIAPDVPRRRTHSTPSRPPPERILFYHSHQRHFSFTNFSPHPILYCGKRYSTGEHLFQSLKVSTNYSTLITSSQTAIPVRRYP